MKCPVDGAQLMMTERSGVEIDYCPECRGVWLDRDELDKIIDRGSPPKREARVARVRYEDVWEPKPRKRREGFLGDLFDF